mmetsp:Transcript_8361/g.10532  ORF Transcript_8361/g.10532 Transcript_8361/m.10532 type:complete len:85 (+) Transcript_8361:3-257(+)
MGLISPCFRVDFAPYQKKAAQTVEKIEIQTNDNVFFRKHAESAFLLNLPGKRGVSSYRNHLWVKKARVIRCFTFYEPYQKKENV